MVRITIYEKGEAVRNILGIYNTVGVQKFSKNLGTTSIFWAPGNRHDASSTLWTQNVVDWATWRTRVVHPGFR